MNSDTIAAIASGVTNAGISVIRISGDSAIEITDKIFKSPSGKRLINQRSHTVHYGFIYDCNGVVDEVMIILMRAPKSYTCEDVVEIDCHGGVTVTRRIFDLVIRAGARTAEPGEFTKRAFMNGRIDLSRAEAVIEVINAKSSRALKNSMNSLCGRIYDIISRQRDKILEDTAYIEAALDDPEHMSLEDFPKRLRQNVEQELDELEKLYKTSDNGKYTRDGIRTLIIGRPNSGKSSLMNLLLNEDRAIVTEIAGTTRDTIEETVDLNGISLNIIDTAGIRITDDAIEQIGVKKAIDNIDLADLIIYVVDSSDKLDENDRKIINLIRDKRTVILYNKTDLKECCDKEEIKAMTNKIPIDFSAKTGRGVGELGKKIAEMFFNGKIEINDEVFISSQRQKEQLGKAIDALRNVINSIDNLFPEDFFTIDLMDAYSCLGNITGENVDEDLVNKIFSEFCMGK